MTFEHMDEDWAREMETGLDDYMLQLYEHLNGEDEEADNFETLSGSVYCGCSTCDIREILTFVIPKAVQGYLDGKVVLDTVEDSKPAT